MQRFVPQFISYLKKQPLIFGVIVVAFLMSIYQFQCYFYFSNIAIFFLNLKSLFINHKNVSILYMRGVIPPKIQAGVVAYD